MIATLITVAIICVLMVVMMQGMGSDMPMRKDGKGRTTYGAARMSAEDDVCRSNLAQVRQALAAARMSSPEGEPGSIEDDGLPAQENMCPIGHEPYQYDAATGEVHCVHPGHEKY